MDSSWVNRTRSLLLRVHMLASMEPKMLLLFYCRPMICMRWRMVSHLIEFSLVIRHFLVPDLLSLLIR